MKRILLFGTILSLLCINLFAQRTISGKVTDESGEGLPGVNVVIKGTTNGATTDLDGNYQLSVSGDDVVLIFSSVGMTKQEVVVGARTSIDISMTLGSTELGEIIVVGYGTQSKKNLTDNVASLKTEDISGVPIASFQNAISGKAAGVRVTQTNGKLESGISVSVRGVSSVSAGSEPLFVLDGIPLINDNESNNGSPVNPLLSIPASEIASIDVLKDASSAAIYGARGANGVVIITTKRGQEGKARFSLNMSTGVSSPTNKREWLNAEEYVELFLEAGRNSSWASEAYVEGRLDRYSNNTWDGPDAYDTDWQEIAFQDGYVKDVDFSVSGGANGSSYYIGASFNDSKGIIRGNELQRVSARANLSQKVNEQLTVGMNFNYSRVEIDRVSNDNAFVTPLQAIALSPISPAYFPEGEDESGPFTNTTYPNFLLQEEFGSYTTVVNRSIGKLFGQYDFTDYISLNSDFAYDILNQTEDSWDGSRVPFQSTNGEAYASNVLSTNYIWSSYATFEKDFGEHGINVVGGMEFNQGNRRFTSVTATEFPSDDLNTVNSGAEVTAGSGSLTAYSFVSYFARASYTFKNRYLLKASIRRDGSSRFGADNRFGTFPAVSAGWILSEEDFLSDAGPLSFLKLRVSYGELGNAELGNFPSRGLFQGVSYNQKPGLAPTQPGNNALSWESATQTDIGVEFGFLDGKISGAFDYYNKNTEGLLFSVPLIPSGGSATINSNIGSMENKGIELLLNAKIISSGDLSWNTSFNISKNNNEVTELPFGNDIISGRNIQREGDVLNSLYLIEYAGVNPDNGDAIYYLNTENPDGSLDRTTTNDPGAAQRVVAGSPVPDWIGGLTNTMSYKGFDFSFTFQGEWGASIYNNGGRFQSANGDWFDNQTKDQLNRWQNPGDITMVPQARLGDGNGASHSTRWLQEANFIRLRNITLAYNLPKSLLVGTGLGGVRIYTTAINALTITDYDGYDPEARADSGGIGSSFYSAPAAKTFTVGVNVNF